MNPASIHTPGGTIIDSCRVTMHNIQPSAHIHALKPCYRVISLQEDIIFQWDNHRQRWVSFEKLRPPIYPIAHYQLPTKPSNNCYTANIEN